MTEGIFHRCTANIYRDFSNQPAPQKALKVALPIIALVALYKVAEYFLSTKTVTDESKPKETSPPLIALQKPAEIVSKKRELLTDPVPATLYTGVCSGKEGDEGLFLQSQRWMLRTNLTTLVKLSTGKAYPANLLKYPASNTSYIIAESPLNNEYVDLQTDFYRMALEQNAGLLVSVACPYKDGTTELHEQYHFVEPGKSITVDNWTVTCDFVVDSEIHKNDQLFHVYKLTCKNANQAIPERNLFQLFTTTVPDGSFENIQITIDIVNRFINDKKITVDIDHPLLVNCRTGLDRSARFILFHELEARIKTLTNDQLKQNDQLVPLQIYPAIFGDQNISALLTQLAQIMEYSTTDTAAVDAITKTILPNFNGTKNCSPADVNTIFKDYALGVILQCILAQN